MIERVREAINFNEKARENGRNRILRRMISKADKDECEQYTNWMGPAPRRMIR